MTVYPDMWLVVARRTGLAREEAKELGLLAMSGKLAAKHAETILREMVLAQAEVTQSAQSFKDFREI